MKARQAKKIYNNLIMNKCKYNKGQINTACHIAAKYYYIHYKWRPEPERDEFFTRWRRK